MMLTVEQVRESLRKAVALKGEGYVYERPATTTDDCFYADPKTGAPSCIAGHVFADLDPAFFARLAELEAKTGESKSIDFIDLFTEVLEPEALLGLGMSQVVQDTGATWGEALRRFEMCIENWEGCGYDNWDS